MPVTIVQFSVKIVDYASIMNAVNAMTNAAAAALSAKTSAMDAVNCAANVLPKRYVRTAVNTVPTVWTISVITAVWDSAVSRYARAAKAAVKTVKDSQINTTDQPYCQGTCILRGEKSQMCSK